MIVECGSIAERACTAAIGGDYVRYEEDETNGQNALPRSDIGFSTHIGGSKKLALIQHSSIDKWPFRPASRCCSKPDSQLCAVHMCVAMPPPLVRALLALWISRCSQRMCP